MCRSGISCLAKCSPVVAGDVNLDAIEAIYDVFMRVVASTQSNHCTASARPSAARDLPDRLFHQSGVPAQAAARPESRRSRPCGLAWCPHRQDPDRAGQAAGVAGRRVVEPVAADEFFDGVEHAAYAARCRANRGCRRRKADVGGSTPHRADQPGRKGSNVRGTFECPLTEYADCILPSSIFISCRNR